MCVYVTLISSSAQRGPPPSLLFFFVLCLVVVFVSPFSLVVLFWFCVVAVFSCCFVCCFCLVLFPVVFGSLWCMFGGLRCALKFLSRQVKGASPWRLKAHRICVRWAAHFSNLEFPHVFSFGGAPQAGVSSYLQLESLHTWIQKDSSGNMCAGHCCIVISSGRNFFLIFIMICTCEEIRGRLTIDGHVIDCLCVFV